MRVSVLTHKACEDSGHLKEDYNPKLPPLHIVDAEGIQYTVDPREDQFESESEPESDDEQTEGSKKAKTSKATHQVFRGLSPEGLKDYIEELVEAGIQKRLSERDLKLVDNKTPTKCNDQNNKVTNESTIKSPSDTTIYAPALNKGFNNQNNQQINKITNFVESMRVQDDRRRVVTSTAVNPAQSSQARGHNPEHLDKNQSQLLLRDAKGMWQRKLSCSQSITKSAWQHPEVGHL